MVVWCSGWHVVFILICNFKFMASAMGPFKSSIVEISPCESPSRPYVKNSPVHVTLTVYNTSNNIQMVGGNITILKDIKNLKNKVKGFIWENNKWKSCYLVHEVDCHSMLMHFLNMALKVKYDRKTCTYAKGQYSFHNFDVNAMQHLWTSSLEYGKMKWRYEVLNPQLGTFVCYNIFTLTEPADIVIAKLDGNSSYLCREKACLLVKSIQFSYKEGAHMCSRGPRGLSVLNEIPYHMPLPVLLFEILNSCIRSAESLATLEPEAVEYLKNIIPTCSLLADGNYLYKPIEISTQNNPLTTASEVPPFWCTALQGPYKSTLQKVKPCDNPSRPYMKDPPMTFDAKMYNNSDSIVFDADFLVYKNTRNVKARVTCFGWEKGKWIPNYLINDMGCHGTLLHLIHKAMGISYDSVNCSYLKGHYHIKNFDQNSMQHVLLSKSEYGRKMWKAEVYNAHLGMFFCIEFYLLIEPI